MKDFDNIKMHGATVKKKYKKDFWKLRVSECLLDLYLSGYDPWRALVKIVIKLLVSKISKYLNKTGNKILSTFNDLRSSTSSGNKTFYLTVPFPFSEDQHRRNPPEGLGYICFTQKMKTLKIDLGYFRDKYNFQPRRKA